MRCAFTLIELLVVVAIIVLLIAILFPSLSRARWGAQRTVCLQSLNQLGAGMVMYALENTEYLPPCKQVKDIGPVRLARGGSTYYGVGNDDMSALYPRWVMNLKLWECPGAKNAVNTKTDLTHTYTPDVYPRVGTAYEYNPFMFNRKVNPNRNDPVKIIWDDSTGAAVSLLKWSKLTRMSETTVAHDSDDSNDPPKGIYNVIPDRGDPHWQLKGGNMMYADGHARFVIAAKWYQETDAGRPILK